MHWIHAPTHKEKNPPEGTTKREKNTRYLFYIRYARAPDLKLIVRRRRRSRGRSTSSTRSTSSNSEIRHGHDLDHERGPAGEMLGALAGARFGVVLLPGEAGAVPLAEDVLDHVEAQSAVHPAGLGLMRALSLCQFLFFPPGKDQIPVVVVVVVSEDGLGGGGRGGVCRCNVDGC